MDRPGEILDGIQRLKRATSELQRHWTDTCQQWDDSSARRFESEHLEAMMPTLRLVLSTTGELNDYFRKVVAQCEDRDRIEY